MSTLTPEEVGQMINGFGLPPGPATMFAAALEAELRKRWFAEPYVYELHLPW